MLNIQVTQVPLIEQYPQFTVNGTTIEVKPYTGGSQLEELIYGWRDLDRDPDDGESEVEYTAEAEAELKAHMTAELLELVAKVGIPNFLRMCRVFDWEDAELDAIRAGTDRDVAICAAAGI